VVPAHPEAFKAQAITLVLEGSKPKHVIAKELGVGLSTLTKWVQRHRQQHGDDAPPSTPAKNLSRERALEEEHRRFLLAR
jgi:transposase